MLNPAYHLDRMREVLREYEETDARKQAEIKLEECALWLTRCVPTREARYRDQFKAPETALPRNRPTIVNDPGT